MSDFKKASDYLISKYGAKGPLGAIYGLLISVSGGPIDDPLMLRRFYDNLTSKEQAAFLIYFGNECMKRLED